MGEMQIVFFFCIHNAVLKCFKRITGFESLMHFDNDISDSIMDWTHGLRWTQKHMIKYCGVPFCPGSNPIAQVYEIVFSTFIKLQRSSNVATFSI